MIEKQQQNQARDVFCHVLPRADDRLWRANVATPTLLCSRMRAATIRGRLQSNLDYPNPFGQGEIWNRSDKQKVRITLTTPTRSIMYAKTYH